MCGLRKNRPMLPRYSALALLLAGTALMPAAAQTQPVAPVAASPAASDDTPSLETIRTGEEVIVTALCFVPSGAITASKTTAPLIETPQSVSVISRDQIDLLNFVDVQQAVRYTAGIVGENYGPDLRFDFLTLRGFIPVEYIDGLQAPVSATIANVGVDLYGFDAVDILKGPASVLYGSSPPGGIYNLTSRHPSAVPGGELQVKYGTNDFKQAAGTVTGELTHGISARLTGLYRDRDGQTDFVNDRQAYGAPAVTFQLGADTRITALGRYQWDRVEGDTNGFLPFNGVATDNPAGHVSRSVNLGEPDYNFYLRRQWGAGYEATHRFSDALRFTQNARWDEYREYQQIVYAGALAADNRTVTRNIFPFKDDVSQFAIDSRLDATIGTGPIEHRLLAGFDYRNYREASRFGFGFLTGGTIDLFDPVYGTTAIVTPPLSFVSTDQRLKQSGLYLQDQAHVGDFILTLSGRQDWTKTNNYTGFGTPERKQDKFTYRIGATYVTTAGIAPYVSYATSFQPVIGQTIGNAPFVPSIGKQWEGGVKYDARTLGDTLKLFATAAVFHIKQSNVLTTDPTNANFQVQTGAVVSKGIELETVARFRQQLSVNASYSYTDAKVTESNIPAQLGARRAAPPRHQASLFVAYIKSTGPLAGIGGGGGVRYLSRNPGALPSAFDPLTYTTQAVTLFDAQLHYDLPGWRFTVNGSNIFDKSYAARCNGPVGCFFGQSRQVIGTVTKKF